MNRHISPRSHALLGLGFLVAASTGAHANLVVNGDFENNSAGSTQYNLSNAGFNALMANATAFGPSNEVDIITTSGYGLDPISGKWKIALHTRATLEQDIVSLDLSAPLVAGGSYTLAFYAQSVLDFDPGPYALEFGVSTSATSFGTQVYAGTPSTSAWTQLGGTFVAPIAGQYLTVRSDSSNKVWNHLDAVSLEVVPEPASVAALTLGIAALARRRKSR